MDSSSIYVERDFSPSSCAKTWIFVKTPHYHASYQKSSLVVSTYCLQEQNMSCYPLMKNDQQGWKGKEIIWSRRWVFWCGSFWKKNLYWCWKLEKIVYPEFILSWQELWFSVFRYCGKCFLAFFSDFISSPPLLFLKKQTNTHTTITEQKEEKRKGNFIINAVWKNLPAQDCSPVCTWLAACIGASPVPSNSALFLQGRTSKC